jgi:hypothetical protein
MSSSSARYEDSASSDGGGEQLSTRRRGGGGGGGGHHQPVKSNVMLQILIWLNQYFLLPYYLIMYFTFVYKHAAMNHYREQWKGLEVAFCTVLLICDVVRLKAGDRGNKLESIKNIFAFIVLDIIQIVGHAYFASYASYVLAIDYGINVIGLALTVTQLVLALAAVVSFGDRRGAIR